MSDAKCIKNAAARTFVLALLTSVSAQTLATPARAQVHGRHGAATSGRIVFDIAPQPLASALGEFARQSGVHALYAYDQLAGIQSQGVTGAFAPDEALARLLANTGYRAKINEAGALELEAPARPQPIRADNPVDATRDDHEAPVLESRSAPASAEADAIVVTGTRIRGHKPIGADLIVLDRSDIETSGQGTIQGLLQTLPQNFPGSQNETTTLNGEGGLNFAFGSSVDLRGLGADATLTLVDGRRLAPAGFGNFTDVSAIPLIAVGRAEILADGASALYGSDAVAGVVNIALRSPIDGAETIARYGAAQGGGEERSFGHLIGHEWESGALLAAYEYYARDALPASARGFASSSDLRARGGDDFSLPYANPGTIVGINGAPVVYAIPEDQNGLTLTEADLIPGIYNLQNAREATDLIPEQERNSIFLSGYQSLTPNVRLFAQALWSERAFHARDDEARLFYFTVPETNAYRLANGLFAGQGPLDIQYSFIEDLGPIERDGQARGRFAVLGLEWDGARTWRFETFAAFADQRDYAVSLNSVDQSALDAALASSDMAAAFNPFAGRSNTNAAALAGLRLDDYSQSDSSIATLSVKADGELFSLPAGAVRMAFGGEYRWERFKIAEYRVTAQRGYEDLSTVRPVARELGALYAELLAPLIADETHNPILEASLAVRYERSDDYGDTLNPKLGLRWTPLDAFALRVSYSTSYRAPQLYQIGSPSQALVTIFPGALDPYATGGATTLLFLGGGSTDLEPETAESWTLGFDFIPPDIERLRLSLTYFSTNFSDRIAQPPNFLAAFSSPDTFGGVFIRNPTQAQVEAAIAEADVFIGAPPAPGDIEAIYDNRLRNIAAVDISGLDLQASYRIPTSLGDFSLVATASLINEMRIAPGPGAAPVNLIDTIGHPADLRARLTGGWSNGPWSASATLAHVDDYIDRDSIPERRVKSWTTWDAQANFDVGAFQGKPNGLVVSLAVLNLFDRDPPFANSFQGLGFDPANASPIGRVASIALRQRW